MTEPQLITVHEYARKHRVDVSIVRWWIKTKRIAYKLVGVRKMVATDALIEPVGAIAIAVAYLKRRDGMDEATATAVVNSLPVEDIAALALEAQHG